MALKVWLPLNKNLDNQGLSDLTFSTLSADTAVDDNGKIGKCYTNASLNAGGVISNTTISLGQKQSMFCWFKFSDLNASSSLGAGLVSQHRYPSNSGMGITIKYVSSTTGYLSVNTGTGSSRTYNTYCGTTLLQANTWYHGGYTYDGTTLKIYVNGVCEKTQAISGMSVPADYLTLFSWSMASSSGNSVYGGYKLHGSLNDVRIYNHCLSPREVKELSRGLVAHYKLDSESIEADTTVVDSSGYGYNGTKNGTFEVSDSTSKYSLSTVFNGSDNAIQIPFCQMLGLTAAGKTDYTWACWIYVTTLSSKGYATILGGQSGFEAETKYNSDGTPKLWAYSWGSNSYSYNLNEWTHIAVTQNSTESKWYVNGELAFTGSSTNIPYGNFFIGSWRDATSQNYKGNVSDFRIYSTVLSADDIKELYQTSASIDNKGGIHDYEVVESDNSRELMAVEYTPSYNANTGKYTLRNDAGEVYFNAASTSCGCNYIEISPSGKTYYYDFILSIASGNQFYIGFERYDANKTSRSNNACIYPLATKPSSDVTYQRYTGTVDLSTDGVNPCKYIRLRVLNGWSGSTSGTTNQATIHQLSLRELDNSKGMQTPKITKQGQLLTDTIREYDGTASFEKKGFADTSEYIEM